MNKLISALVLGLALLQGSHADTKAPVQVVYFDNYAPYSWLDSDGKMRGVFIDILDAVIGQRMGYALEHKGLPWARAQEHVRLGIDDAMIAPVTEARGQYTNISQHPVLNSRMALFTNATHPRMRELQQTRSLQDVKSYKFVTQLGDGWAGENLREMDVNYVGDLDSVLRVLSLGRADLFVEASLVTHWNLKNLGLATEVSEVEGVTIELTPYHLMVSKQSARQILPEFDQQMQAFMRSGEFQRLLEKYKQ